MSRNFGGYRGLRGAAGSAGNPGSDPDPGRVRRGLGVSRAGNPTGRRGWAGDGAAATELRRSNPRSATRLRPDHQARPHRGRPLGHRGRRASPRPPSRPRGQAGIRRPRAGTGAGDPRPQVRA